MTSGCERRILLGQFDHGAEVVAHAQGLLQRGDDALERLELSHRLLGRLLIVPEAGAAIFCSISVIWVFLLA